MSGATEPGPSSGFSGYDDVIWMNDICRMYLSTIKWGTG